MDSTSLRAKFQVLAIQINDEFSQPQQFTARQNPGTTATPARAAEEAPSASASTNINGSCSATLAYSVPTYATQTPPVGPILRVLSQPRKQDPLSTFQITFIGWKEFATRHLSTTPSWGSTRTTKTSKSGESNGSLPLEQNYLVRIRRTKHLDKDLVIVPVQRPKPLEEFMAHPKEQHSLSLRCLTLAETLSGKFKLTF